MKGPVVSLEVRLRRFPARLPGPIVTRRELAGWTALWLLLAWALVGFYAQ